MLGRGYLSQYGEYALSPTLSIYIKPIPIVLKISYATVDFHLFYDGAANMQIWTLLKRSQCRVSDS